MEAKFWRLLSAYESLTCEEAAALRDGNYRYFSSIHNTKAEILPELLKLADSLGICTKDPYLKTRMARLVDTVRSNAGIVKDHIEANTAARRKAHAAARRLRCFDKIYSNPFCHTAKKAYAA